MSTFSSRQMLQVRATRWATGLIATSFVLAGCGSSLGGPARHEAPTGDAATAGDSDFGGDPGPGDADTSALQGVLLGGPGPNLGPIAGAHFATATGAGRTDAQGHFIYHLGEQVIFSVGDIELGSVRATPQVTLFTLSGRSDCQLNAPLQAMLVLFESLDTDHDSTNGIQLPDVPVESPLQQIGGLSPAQLAAAIDAISPGAPVVATNDAVDHFIAQVDGETWQQQLPYTTFSAAASITRSQGFTTDGSNWIFAWDLGLQQTDAAFNNTSIANSNAIPSALQALGDNHIGDIDYANGTVYAPIEDGSAYQHPSIALYDSSTLAYTGKDYPISTTLQSQGVPWVAVDATANRLYLAQWDPTLAINVFSLDTVSYVGSIPLHTTLGRLQGGKVFHGMLYVSRDNAAKSFYKINLQTGTVLHLFDLGETGVELEGLALTEDTQGVWLRTIDVNSTIPATEMHLFKRVQAPWRDTLCPP